MSTSYGEASGPMLRRGAIPALIKAASEHKRLCASLLIGLAAAFVLIAVKQSFADNFPFDFAYFHAAGRAWIAGMDPYGPAYAHFALPYIPKESALWAYPPQWWSITVALASLEMTPATIVWKSASLLALLAGSALLFDVLRDTSGRAWIATALIFSIVLSSSDAAWIALRIGQTSLFMLFGVALVLHGLKFEGEKRIALGLAILLMKPQFGLLFLLLLMGVREARRPAIAAVALSALACLPVLFTFGIQATIESAFRFLSNLSSYEGLSWNRPGSLTGISFITSVLELPSPPTIMVVVAAWGIAGWLCRKAAEQGNAVDPVHRCLIGLAAFYAIVPLHNYDLILMPIFILILPELTVWAGGLIALALLSTWRLGSFAFAIYGEQVSSWRPGVFLSAFVQAGVGTFAVSVVLVAIAFGRKPQGRFGPTPAARPA